MRLINQLILFRDGMKRFKNIFANKIIMLEEDWEEDEEEDWEDVDDEDIDWDEFDE